MKQETNELRIYAAFLWSLAFLFFLRVLGQLLVANFEVTLLPPMDQWYSGLIPYPTLLPIQVLILLFQLKICMDFSSKRGVCVVPRVRLGVWLHWFSYLYFSSMAVRYLVTMALYPERRWLGGTIPIFFHFVLAGLVFTLGHYHAGRNAAAEITREALC